MLQRLRGFWPAAGLMLLPAVLMAPAHAHHPLEGLGMDPSPMSGLISGIGHIWLGPDHFIFLLAIGLIGLRQPRRWMLPLVALALLGTAIGLQWQGLPLAEPLVALTLVVEGLVVIGRLPVQMVLPAALLHGYVLSASVIGWEATPIAFYLLGLLLAQLSLLLVSITLVRRWCAQALPLCGGLLIGIGAAFAWSMVMP